jgi:hypothetical protein
VGKEYNLKKEDILNAFSYAAKVMSEEGIRGGRNGARAWQGGNENWRKIETGSRAD